ncbi:unnamed protein product, partial [Heterotrigona itama]
QFFTRHFHHEILSGIYSIRVFTFPAPVQHDDVLHIYPVSRMHYVPPVTQSCRRTKGPNWHG